MYHDKRTQAHLLGNNAGELGGRCPQDMSHHQCPTERERSLALHAHTTPSAKLIQARWRISTETGDSLPERESGTRERERERDARANLPKHNIRCSLNTPDDTDQAKRSGIRLPFSPVSCPSMLKTAQNASDDPTYGGNLVPFYEV